MNLPSAEKVRDFFSPDRLTLAADVGSRMLMGAVLITGMSEAVTHAEEVCETGQDYAALAVMEVTGELPSWASPRIDAFSQEASQMMDSLLVASPQPVQPQQCLPGFLIQKQ